jgi:hypothetical protein
MGLLDMGGVLHRVLDYRTVFLDKEGLRVVYSCDVYNPVMHLV